MIIDCSEKNATKWLKSSAIVKPRRNRINVSIDSRLDDQVDFILGCIKTNIKVVRWGLEYQKNILLFHTSDWSMLRNFWIKPRVTEAIGFKWKNMALSALEKELTTTIPIFENMIPLLILAL